MSEPTEPVLSEEEVELLARKIYQQIAGILDRQQRSYALGKKLKKLPPETILEIFKVTVDRAQQKVPLYQDAFRTVSDVKRLGRYIGFDKMSEIYTLARRHDYADVVRFMRQVPAARRLGDDEEIEDDPVLREMTLGTKRQKARMPDRDMIERLCNEQDPLVIQNLLKNPRVTIRQVVKIASKRPTSARILWVIYRDLRWVNHYVVKKALINNPYTPTQISLSLLHFLLEQDLEDVADNMLLHEQVKDAAVDLILKKRNALKKREEERQRQKEEEENREEDSPD